jgi:hypothetical protein
MLWRSRGELKMTLDLAMPRICETAAEAVYRYAEISGEDPGDDMPESFLTAFVFEKLGSETMMTVETNCKKLWRWNQDIGKRCSKAISPADNEGVLEEIVRELPNGRVDLVIHTAGFSQDWGFAGLIEFKRHYVVWDRPKLLEILNYIDTCPAAAVCCLAHDRLDAEWLQKAKLDAEQDGDHWYGCDVRDLPHGLKRSLSICSRVFTRRADSIPGSGVA